MPGPKMGARPHDFDEDIVRQAPTFKKWQSLQRGETLRYACREFVKGHGDDEERLMRRIMIARRNNLRDHEILKRARAQTSSSTTANQSPTSSTRAATGKRKNEKNGSKRKDEQSESSPEVKKKRIAPPAFPVTDEEVLKEMDTPAVEATRSYKTWSKLGDGDEFTYNQTYIKGKAGHDWLLKKNIWRRMRYRRENKKMVEKLKGEGQGVTFVYEQNKNHSTDQTALANAAAAAAATQIVDQALLAGNTEVGSASDVGSEDQVHAAVVEAAVAAVAAAESYVQKARESDSVDLIPPTPPEDKEDIKVEDSDNNEITGNNVGIVVHNPIMSTASASASNQESHASDTINHTPNPLISLDGDTLDVAAKLAAAASAAEQIMTKSKEDDNDELVQV